MITDLYHFTSQKNWKTIQQEKVLRPLSDPRKEELPRKLQSIISENKYLVGIPTASLDAWKQWGIMYHLEEWVVFHNPYDYDHKKKDLVCLQVPVLEGEKAFVREHKYIADRYLNQQSPNLSRDLHEMWRSSGMSEVSKERFQIFVDCLKEYLASLTILNDYKNDFEVPEIWLPQETPVALIKRKINRKKLSSE